MIATGNHIDEGFAARSTTPLESPGAHRRFLWSTLTGKICLIPHNNQDVLFHDARPADY